VPGPQWPMGAQPRAQAPALGNKTRLLRQAVSPLPPSPFSSPPLSLLPFPPFPLSSPPSPLSSPTTADGCSTQSPGACPGHQDWATATGGESSLPALAFPLLSLSPLPQPPLQALEKG